MLIEYDGTDYHGFQYQPKLPTIQGEIESALKRITGEKIRLFGAGRTDSGVHARGQVASFSSESQLQPITFLKALNSYLPLAILIRDSCLVDTNFDPRRFALSREYEYTIVDDSVMSPFLRRWSFLVPGELNIELMNSACRTICGTHDFSPFTNKEGGAKTTTRTVYKAEVQKRKPGIVFTIIANSFLPQQVRRIVGSLVKIGTGKLDLEEFNSMASSGIVGEAKYVVPSQGLCLVKVNYSSIGFNHYENI